MKKRFTVYPKSYVQAMSRSKIEMIKPSELGKEMARLFPNSSYLT